MSEAPGAALATALAWARRGARRSAAAEHELLEVPAAASLEEVRAAYHKLARLAHPDLHRAAATVEELEELTMAFARVSNAYSLMTARSRKAGPATSGNPAATAPTHGGGAARPPVARRAEDRPPASGSAGPPEPASAPGGGGAGGAGASRGTPSGASRGEPSGKPSGMPGVINNGPATGLSTKAKLHYRRAELCLRRGELVEARLHLRLALASDPQSTFLRRALEEIDRG